MAQLDRQIKELFERLATVRDILAIPDMKVELEELEKQMSAPDFWSDQNNAKKIGQQAADIKSEVESWESIQEDLRETSEVAQLAHEEKNEEMQKEMEDELKKIETRLEKLELNTLLSGEHDMSNAIVSLHAGAGGTDAADWAGMLMRMFIRFAEQRNWSVEVLDQSNAEEAGIKSATFAVRGRFAYGMMKAEAGVHRLVRISPFDAEKMRHTSFALVEVIPELSEIHESNLEIEDKDLRIDTYAASGAGGQSVNTTNSAVRITHLPTNTVVAIQNERSQQQNRLTAMKILKSRLYQKLVEEQQEKIADLKGGHKAPEWGNQIRSYVLHPYKMVKDHRTNFETQDVDKVLNGDLEAFIESYLKMQASKK